MAEPLGHPILVLSSNRPLELSELLLSLMRQDGGDVGKRPVFLFQDGGRDRIGATVHWSDAVLLENLDIFRRLVPHGIPLPSYHHLGAALNRDRAERFAFEELGADAAIALTDELVLGPCYLRMTDRLLALALASPRIGQVSADGDSRASRSAQLADASRLAALHRPRGVGLVRAAWRRQRPYMTAYLQLVRDRDDKTADPAAVRSLFQGWGMDASDTSFEAATAHACVLTGAARLGTVACYARHLERHPQRPDAPLPIWSDGFDGPAVVEDNLASPSMPTEEDLAALIAGAAGWGRGLPGSLYA